MMISEVCTKEEVLKAYDQAFNRYDSDGYRDPNGSLDPDGQAPSDKLMDVILKTDHNPEMSLWHQLWEIVHDYVHNFTFDFDF